jgi:hypothetical protein
MIVIEWDEDGPRVVNRNEEAGPAAAHAAIERALSNNTLKVRVRRHVCDWCGHPSEAAICDTCRWFDNLEAP